MSEDEKGTCCVCGDPVPDSVVCDRCFMENWVKPTMASIIRNRDSRQEPTDG